MTETTQMQSTNLQHSISSTTYPCILTPCKYQSIIQYWNREKIKIYLWDIRILCATEQNQKSKCEHTQHKLFKSKWPKQHKCNQQIYYTQSQVQHYPCILTPPVFPSKEHESKVPKPPPIYTAPPCNDILTLIKFMRDMRMW